MDEDNKRNVANNEDIIYSPGDNTENGESGNHNGTGTEFGDIDYYKAYENIDFTPYDQGMNAAGNYNEDDQEEIQDDGAEAPREKKVRIPVWVFIFLILIIALNLISMLRFPEVVRDYKIYKTAEARIRNSQSSQVVNDLYALARKHPDSTPIQVKAVELSMETGNYDIAGNLIDNYLTEKDLSDSDYNKINSYFPKLESYYAANDAVNKIFTDAANSYTDETTYYEEVNSKLKALLKDETLDMAYVYYSLAVIEPYIQMARNYMQQCYNSDPECFDVRGQLSIMYRRLRDFEKAKQYAYEALKKDKADSTALRALSTIALVEGDLEGGLKYAKDAYHSNPDGLYIRETLLIALTLNGESNEARKLQEEMTAAGETLDDETKQLINGSITLEDYYLGE